METCSRAHVRVRVRHFDSLQASTSTSVISGSEYGRRTSGSINARLSKVDKLSTILVETDPEKGWGISYPLEFF